MNFGSKYTTFMIRGLPATKHPASPHSLLLVSIGIKDFFLPDSVFSFNNPSLRKTRLVKISFKDFFLGGGGGQLFVLFYLFDGLPNV